MFVHTLSPGGRPHMSVFFAGGAHPVYGVRNCTCLPRKIPPCQVGTTLLLPFQEESSLASQYNTTVLDVTFVRALACKRFQ
jgi:hypothetical protein